MTYINHKLIISAEVRQQLLDVAILGNINLETIIKELNQTFKSSDAIVKLTGESFKGLFPATDPPKQKKPYYRRFEKRNY